MSDSIDIAARANACYEAAALSHREPSGPAPDGYCHFCGEPLPDDLRWCDARCRDDWQSEQDAAERRGQTGGNA